MIIIDIYNDFDDRETLARIRAGEPLAYYDDDGEICDLHEMHSAFSFARLEEEVLADCESALVHVQDLLHMYKTVPHHEIPAKTMREIELIDYFKLPSDQNNQDGWTDIAGDFHPRINKVIRELMDLRSAESKKEWDAFNDEQPGNRGRQ